MSKLTEYRVLRNHEGDRFYSEGDTRKASPDEVKHLIGTVLEPIVAAPKAAPARKKAAPVANKAEGAAASNKAQAPRKRKGK